MIKEILEIKQSVKDFYNVKNDTCPICDRKFEFVVPMIRVDGKGYHLSCYEKITRNKLGGQQ